MKTRFTTAILAIAALAIANTATSASVSAHNRGYPDAVPPILPTASRSELAQLEAWESEQFSFSSGHPSNAPYSDVEMNAFSRDGYAGSR